MPKSKRKGISKRTRFEVFKRDSFACQYCGAKAPDAILVIDHIHPVAAGGDSGLLNLITSCENCNSGKSDKLLSDNSTVEKQRTQIELLQAKREQIDMMIEWRESLLQISDYEVDKLIEFINNRIPPYKLKTELCEPKLKEYKKRWGMNAVLTAIETACAQYLKTADGVIIQNSVDVMLEKLPGICNNMAKYAKNPELRIIDSIRYHELKHLSYFDVKKFYMLCEYARDAGYTAEEIKRNSEGVHSWSHWKRVMQEMIGGNFG